VAGSCDTTTGFCSDPAKPDDTACDDANACTQADSCELGVCSGASPVVCVAKDQCHTAGVCDTTTGFCSDPAKPDDTPCDDGNACTQADSCQSGVCTGANPVVCVAKDQCHVAGSCDTAAGLCSDPAKPDDTACDDASACTRTDSCQSGVCAGADPVECVAKDQCHEAGICDTATGLCSEPARQDESVCDDADACTTADLCRAGVCVGESPRTCTPPDDCHEAGVCHSDTGECSFAAKGDGSPCETGTCLAGVCQAPDAGPPDAGTTDAGSPDASEPDAGSTDAGPPDASEPDAGIADAGSPDAGAQEIAADSGPNEPAQLVSPFGCECGAASAPSLLWCALLLLCVRRRRILAATLAAAVSLAPAAQAQDRAPAPLKVAVLGLRAAMGADPKLADVLTETLGTCIQTRIRAQVISTREVEGMLGFEKQKQLVGRSDNAACLAEIGGSLGVDRLVIGSLARVGATVLLSFQLVDPAKATVVQRYQTRMKGAADEDLFDAVEPAVIALFASASSSPAVSPPTPSPAALPAGPAAPSAPARSSDTPAALAPATPAPAPESRPSGDRWTLTLRGSSQLNAPRGVAQGGAAALLAGYRPIPVLPLALGAAWTPAGWFGATARAGWIPFNSEGMIRPVLAAEASYLFGEKGVLTVGPSAGVEIAPLRGVLVGAEAQLAYAPGAPSEYQTTFVFASVSAAWRR